MTRPDATSIPLDALALQLEDDLVRRYGILLSSRALASVLGYCSTAAYQQAIARGAVPVPLFRIESRRGRFALAKDVARWLSQKRASVSTSDGPDEDDCQTRAASRLDHPMD